MPASILFTIFRLALLGAVIAATGCTLSLGITNSPNDLNYPSPGQER